MVSLQLTDVIKVSKLHQVFLVIWAHAEQNIPTLTGFLYQDVIC